MATYTACELAFAAGFRIRRVPRGTVAVHQIEGMRPLLELGPSASAAAVVAVVRASGYPLPRHVRIDGLGLPSRVTTQALAAL